MKKKNLYIRECFKYKGIVAFIFMLLIIETYVVFKLPFKMEAMNDLLFHINKDNYKNFILCFLGYVGFSVVQVGIFLVLNITYKQLSNKITSGIVLKLYQKIYSVKIKWPSQFTVDEVMQTVNGDAYKLGDNGIKIVFQMIRIVINVAGLLFYMVTTNIQLAVMITLNFLVVMLIQKKLNNVLANKLKKLKVTYGKYAYTSNTFFGNYLNYRHIKAGNYFKRLIKKDMQHYLDDSLSIEKVSSVNVVFGSLSNLFNILIVMGAGAYMLLNGNITLGVLITFSTFANIFGNYITGIPGLFMQIKEFGISYERVMKIMDVECHEEVAEEGNGITQEQNNVLKREIDLISLKDVFFSYNGRNAIITGFSHDFQKNAIYCIVGENGAGKTTLINLILGEYGVTNGSTKVNNQELNFNEFMNVYREHVTYCPSTRLLFDDTIKNNIALDKEVDDSEIEEIMRELQIDGDSALKLDREVNEMQNNLSDGQKQKLNIVRSILEGKEIMVFDEIEMHLDMETKKNVMKYLNRIKQDKIIIIVSHDTYVIEQSDIMIRL